GGQQVLQDRARFCPGRATQRHEGVERTARKQGCSCRRPRRKIISGAAAEDSGRYITRSSDNITKMTELFQNREIKNQVADGNTGARHTVTRSENPVGEILNREIRIRRNVNKRFTRHLL